MRPVKRRCASTPRRTTTERPVRKLKTQAKDRRLRGRRRFRDVSTWPGSCDATRSAVGGALAPQGYARRDLPFRCELRLERKFPFAKTARVDPAQRFFQQAGDVLATTRVGQRCAHNPTGEEMM